MAINSESVRASRGTRPARLLGAGLLAASIAILGCGEPQVAPSHRDLLLQLATASSTRDPAMMDRLAADVDRLAAAGELADNEENAFRAIIGAAADEDWDRARDLAYSLRDGQHPTAEDQERVARRTVREIKKVPGRSAKP